jgi:hypothetical protein
VILLALLALLRSKVVPEIDMPGHMTAWGRALPEYNLTINTGSRHGELDYGIANFASKHLFPTVQKVVDETSDMFSDELFFFGGDETACPYNECVPPTYHSECTLLVNLHPSDSGAITRAIRTRRSAVLTWPLHATATSALKVAGWRMRVWQRGCELRIDQPPSLCSPWKLFMDQH